MRTRAVGRLLLLLPLVACTLLAALHGSAARAQTRVYAGSNDTPDVLINAAFSNPTMTYGTAATDGGATTGGLLNQVRVFQSTSPGCSMVAQTHSGSDNVSIFVIDAAGGLHPAPGSPFATGAGTQSLAWAPDGGALYVPLAVGSSVVTLTVSCTAGGGSPTVANAGSVALTGFSQLRDAAVIGAGAGTHLCVTGTLSNNVGCFPLTARIPGTTAVNTITVPLARGIRIAPNNCGFAALGSASTVQAFTVSAGGTITATNTGTTSTQPRYGAITADGSLVAVGCDGPAFTLFSMNGSCQITLVGSNVTSPPALDYYTAFDANNLLYVSDSGTNQIRVFAPTAGGIGAAISTSTINHAGSPTAPGGIDVALASSLPVELLELTVE